MSDTERLRAEAIDGWLAAMPGDLTGRYRHDAEFHQWVHRGIQIARATDDQMAAAADDPCEHCGKGRLYCQALVLRTERQRVCCDGCLGPQHHSMTTRTRSTDG